MLRKARLSILALYKYDDTIFDAFSVPDGLDRQTIVDNILMECAELETVYPDAEFIKGAIASWSAMMAPVWQELYDTTQYEYNPIWNKDGTFRETIHTTNTDTHDTMGYNSNSWAHSNKTDGDGWATREHTEQGNIGVTTTQEMIKQQREVAEFNIMARIVDDFKMRFCILVY